MSRGLVEEALALLDRTPRVLEQLLVGLPDGWLGVPDVERDGWTARDVIGHLITTETAVWLPRVEMLIEHGTSRTFETFDRFAHLERDRGVGLHELGRRFGQLRAASVERVRRLVPDDSGLDRHGMHPQFGEVTLHQFLAAWTVHDLDHTAQVLSSLAASRDRDVGPWKVNLGILLRRDAAAGS